VAEKSGGGDGLRKDDADGDEDGAAAGSIRNGNFEACTFGILVAAAESDAASREVFANGDFFLKAATADACKDTSLYAGTISARNDTFFDWLSRVEQSFWIGLRENFHPNRRGIAKFAEPGDASANFEGAQFQLVEIDNFAALAKTALHEHAGKGFISLGEGWELYVPEIRPGIEEVDGVEKAFGFFVNFSDDTGASGFGEVAFERPL
jgi:hypothetical protein